MPSGDTRPGRGVRCGSAGLSHPDDMDHTPVDRRDTREARVDSRSMRVALALLLACGSPTVPHDPTQIAGPQPRLPAPALADATQIDAAPVWRSCLLDQAGPCVSDVPVRIGSEFVAWADWLAAHALERADHHPLGLTECRWVVELPEVLLCNSADAQSMRDALARASMFVEHTPRVVVRPSHWKYRRLVTSVGGYDLEKHHPERPDLLEFYAAVDRACPTDRSRCLLPAEHAMRELLERTWPDRPRFVLLAVGGGEPMQDDAALSHEILHAQYFLDERYRATVDTYWNELPGSVRDEIRTQLARHYNAADDYLLRNEFQAFVLMSRPRGLLRTFAWDHAGPLRASLAAAGVPPIAVDLRPME
jgi:hypothetical protein